MGITIREAYDKVKMLTGKHYIDCLPDELKERLLDGYAKKNKGIAGQVLELYIGKPLDTKHIDFDDGELKQSKTNKKKVMSESTAITMLGHAVDELYEDDITFLESCVGTKMERTLFVGMRNGMSLDPSQWSIDGTALMDLHKARNAELLRMLEEDFHSIQKQARSKAERGAMMGTINGPNDFLQIRTKGSALKTPIYSQRFGRAISTKNFAFYAKTKFTRRVMAELG